MGFNLIKREQTEKMRAMTETIAVQVQGFERAAGRTYALGITLPSGEEVRVTPAAWWSHEFRRRFEELASRLEPGAVVAFANCERNQNGTYMASSYRLITRSAEENYRLLDGQDVRVGPVIEKENGKLIQTLQCAMTKEAVQVEGYDEAVEQILACLSKSEVGKPGAIIRGVDEDGVAMAACVNLAWDWDARRLCSPEETLERFLEDPKVNVSGIGIKCQGGDFMGFLERFPDASWEVMPMRSLSMGLRNYSQDKSPDYRFDAKRQATGFVPSLVGVYLDESGRYFVNAVMPTGGSPVPMAYLHTRVVQPEFVPAAVAKPARPTVRQAPEPQDEGVSLEDLVETEAKPAESTVPPTKAVESQPQETDPEGVQNVAAGNSEKVRNAGNAGEQSPVEATEPTTKATEAETGQEEPASLPDAATFASHAAETASGDDIFDEFEGEIDINALDLEETAGLSESDVQELDALSDELSMALR